MWFSPTSRHLAVVSEGSKTLHFYDFSTNKVVDNRISLKNIRGSSKKTASFSKDGKLLSVVGIDYNGLIRVEIFQIVDEKGKGALIRTEITSSLDF